MTTVAVSEVKARLSHYLGKVKAGEEVIITDRGEPVARLCPLSQAGAHDGRLARLEKRGLMRVGTGSLPRGFWNRRRAADPDGAVVAALLEEREGGR